MCNNTDASHWDTIKPMRIVHRGLRRFYESGDARRINPNWLPRIKSVLTVLAQASAPQDLDIPGFGLHPLKGDRRGQWGVTVSRNWRIVFKFEDGRPVDVDLVDYH